MQKMFGTDGIRGVANVYPMTPEIALKVGKAIARVFDESVNGEGKPQFLIGRDTRLSGHMLENALTAGLTSMGGNVTLAGLLPTPAIAYLTQSLKANAGIVISASHNPAEDNGIKVFSAEGIKLSDDIEAQVENLVLESKLTADHIHGAKIGRATQLQDAGGRYIKFVKDAVGRPDLAGIKVVLDCANGAAYDVAPRILRELGAQVVALHTDPDGLNINCECGALHPNLLSDQVRGNGANLGVCLDGDADRVILLDEQGQVVDGDQLLAIAALDMLENGELANRTLVVTQYSNHALDELLEQHGATVIRTKNGDRYVTEAMRKHGYTLGGEQSGHLVFGQHAYTGDGIVAALKIIDIMKRTGKPLSSLASVLQKYPQVHQSVAISERRPLDQIPEFVQVIESANEQLGAHGRTVVRYSGTQNLLRIMVEGRAKDQIEQIACAIAAEAEKQIGASHG